ncbi:LysR family transcriptional regulator [Roseivivax isoporae]|uniref:LysR family transcriptional regulator n=1 Tax=Roseivivax isoporae LMG 25204 TaxID=1449351 RepID=X7F886_9RHOB|nr:LysR family transcriptional regulator [Roseivivax isoporae]ETX28943.1 LysR family transcriptional regulator [Roseivivax isoporae LMG 25204]
MDRVHAMRVFLEVARERSFAGAARKLDMSAASVTRTVAALESRIGADLFVRTTRTVRLTEAGARFEPECDRILADIDEAEAAAAGVRARPVGTLTITAPVLFGQIYVAPLVTAFCDQYPDVDVQLLLVDRVTNLADEGIDVALRIGRMPDSSLRAASIGTVRQVVVGAPTYFREHGVPGVPDDLRRHRIVAVTSAYSAVEWRFGRKEKVSVRVQPRIRCSTNGAAIGIAAEGWALTRVLSYQVAPMLRDGRLQLTLEDHEEAPLPVQVVHAGNRTTPAKVRAFVDFITDRLRADPAFAHART